MGDRTSLQVYGSCPEDQRAAVADVLDAHGSWDRRTPARVAISTMRRPWAVQATSPAS